MYNTTGPYKNKHIKNSFGTFHYFYYASNLYSLKKKWTMQKIQTEGKIMYGTVYQFIPLATDIIVLGAEKNTQMTRTWTVPYRRDIFKYLYLFSVFSETQCIQ